VKKKTYLGTPPCPRTYAAALACQERLRPLVRLQPLPAPPRLVVGVDAAYGQTDRHVFGAAVVMSLPELAVIETASACTEVDFPYYPGLFSFREAPILRTTLEKLRQPPDVILVDGQGIAHPRGLGLATYLGLLIGIPTIGCAKSRLAGQYGELNSEKGSFGPLTWQEKQVGWVLRSHQGKRPLFISPGYLITLAESLDLIRQCLGKYLQPLPLREAHVMSRRLCRQGCEAGTCAG
jgi:deoxyribonuclease V